MLKEGIGKRCEDLKQEEGGEKAGEGKERRMKNRGRERKVRRWKRGKAMNREMVAPEGRHFRLF